MFTNTTFQRTAKATRFLAVAAFLAVSFSGGALAQGKGGGGGGGGGGSMPNAVLKCLGPDCINVSQAQSACTASYCQEEEEKKDSCDVRICEIENGRRTCRIEVSYDERICIKQNLL